MTGKCRIKKGDMVMVIAGKERGKTGKILEVLTKNGRVTVEKLNIIKRHTKPNAKNKQGGILERGGIDCNLECDGLLRVRSEGLKDKNEDF